MKLKKKEMKLPDNNYGPFLCRILKEFITHNNLPQLSLPNRGDSTIIALTKIFDIISYSMGDKKREEILTLLDEYKLSIESNHLD